MTDLGLTRDGFLGGRLSIRQPKSGYRAGVDAVFLAAAVPAASGEAVLELGCGVGTALYCLGARVPGLSLAGIERQPDYAALARRNAEENGLNAGIFEGRIERLPAELRDWTFDHVIANPPYWRGQARTKAGDAGRETALAEETPLSVWCDVGVRRLRPGGWLTMIQAAERLPDVMAALDGRVGAVTVHPLAPRSGRDATRVIVQAVKGSRATARLASPTALHEGTAHERDGESYTDDVRAILRDGAAFPWVGR